MEQRLNEAPCGFLSLNHNGVIIEINTTLLTWLGYQRESLLYNHFEKLLSTPNKVIFHSYFYPTIHLHRKIDELFIHLKHRDGSAIPHLVNAHLLEVDGLEITDCIFMPMTKRISYETELRITKKQLEAAYTEKEQAFTKLQLLHEEIEQKQMELMQMNTELLELSNTDKLTGIPNRRFFEQQLQYAIERFFSAGEPFSLCLLDIDFFKQVNDTYGHAVGDLVLKKLAALIKDHIRPRDIFARFGGEEFVLLLPNIEDHEALKYARFINQLIAQAAWPETGGITISVGVNTFKNHYTADDLLERADRALYASKKNGRNQATLADSLVK
ncbi:MAG: sensor domain-containing diguanylate cyclase [Solibacillus sp.]